MSESLDSPVFALEQGKCTEQFPHLLKDKNYDQPLNDTRFLTSTVSENIMLQILHILQKNCTISCNHRCPAKN